MRRALLVLAFAGALLQGCVLGPQIPVDPSSVPGSPLVLTFDGRGSPPVILRINGTDVAHLGCGQGETLTVAPGAGGVPGLPWQLEVIRQGDGRVLLNERVTTMPKWLLLWPDGSGGLGALPALGPAPPTCAPA